MTCKPISVYFHKVYNIRTVVGMMGSTSVINLVQGDTGPKLCFQVVDCAGDPIVSGVSAVYFHISQVCGGEKTNCGHEQVSASDPSTGTYCYSLSGGDISGYGSYQGELELLYDNGTTETSFTPIRMFVRESNKAATCAP